MRYKSESSHSICYLCVPVCLSLLPVTPEVFTSTPPPTSDFLMDNPYRKWQTQCPCDLRTWSGNMVYRYIVCYLYMGDLDILIIYLNSFFNV